MTGVQVCPRMSTARSFYVEICGKRRVRDKFMTNLLMEKATFGASRSRGSHGRLRDNVNLPFHV